MDRRNFLRAAGGAATLAAVGGTGWAAFDAAAEMPAFLSACNLDAGPSSFGAAALDRDGRILWRQAMAARGHEVAFDPARRLCAAVDRKPGAAITLCDLRSGKVIHSLPALAGWHFDGHAVFSADSSTLFASESRVGDELGGIGIYRVADGARLGAFSTAGIEPHQMIWSADRRSFIVANGGIVERNADGEIESGLAAIDASSGNLIAKYRLDGELATLSFRHIAVTHDNDVLIGMQDQDTAGDLRPIVAIMSRQGEFSFFDTPEATLERMQGYIGSVAVDPTQRVVVATAPHGGLAGFWRLADRKFLGSVDLPDGCGAAATGRSGEFLLTSGRGDRLLVSIDAAGRMTQQILAHPTDGLPRWDNHLTLV